MLDRPAGFGQKRPFKPPKANMVLLRIACFFVKSSVLLE
jgi:hypothetical protein